eukprot:365593-Chlamydomonas_euryale.AAC.11
MSNQLSSFRGAHRKSTPFRHKARLDSGVGHSFGGLKTQQQSRRATGQEGGRSTSRGTRRN